MGSRFERDQPARGTLAPMPEWLTPALLIALFAWLRRDMGVFRREVRADLADVRRDLADVRDRVSRLGGRIDGWQDRLHPPAA